MMKKEIENLKNSLESFGLVIPSGSYFISGNDKSDIDFFVYGSPQIHGWLKRNGFTCDLHAVSDDQMENSMKDCEGFVSYRNGKFNVIAHRSVEKLKKLHLATNLCIALELKKKSDVLFVFNAIQLGLVSDKKTSELEKGLTK